MNLNLKILIVIAVITIPVLFVFAFLNEPGPEVGHEINDDVYYEVGLSGVEDQYVVGEEIVFSIFLNGFGTGCGDYKGELQKDDKILRQWDAQLNCPKPKGNFVELNSLPSGYGPYNFTLIEPGSYTALGRFTQGIYGSFQTTQNFTVIEP